MNLKEILSISGQSGLYKYVAQGKGGIIVEALDKGGKRQMVSGSARVSALGDIAMFTDEKEVALAEIFTAIFKAEGGKVVAVCGKSTPAELDAFMKIALPSYDRERVHNSDIKKLASWYNILVEAGVTSFEEEAEASEAPVSADKPAAPKAAVKPKAAVAAKPKAASSKSKVTATKSTTARKAQ